MSVIFSVIWILLGVAGLINGLLVKLGKVNPRWPWGKAPLGLHESPDDGRCCMDQRRLNIGLLSRSRSASCLVGCFGLVICATTALAQSSYRYERRLVPREQN